MKFWQSFYRTWSQQAAMQFATLSVLIGAYAAVSSALLVQQNLQALLTRWGSEVKVNVYLTDDISENEIRKVSSGLKESELFSSIELVSKDEALKRFKDRLGALAPNMAEDSSFENPLPMSLESLMSKNANVGAFDSLVELADQISLMAGVEEVSYGQGWIENYASAIGIFNVSSWALIFILVAGSLFVIGNAIKSSVIQRKDEIEIMELFGATKWTIQVPFILEGLVMGLAASAGAILLVLCLYAWQSQVLIESLNFWNLKNAIEFLSWPRVFFILFGGGVSGALGSYLCIKQVSNGWTAAEGN